MEVLKFSEMRLKKDKVVFQLPIHKIRSNPYQPRKYFNRTALEELADSIRAYGILQPITVRKMSGGAYESPENAACAPLSWQVSKPFLQSSCRSATAIAP